MQNPFINEENIRKTRSSAIRRTVVAAVFLLFNGTGYLGILLDVGGAAFSDAVNIAGTMVFLMVVALIMTPFVLLLLSGLRRRRYAGRAEQYGRLFAEDEDGYLLYSEAAERLSVSAGQVADDVKELLRRQLIQNVQYMDGTPGCILLTDGHTHKWHSAYYYSEPDAVSEGYRQFLGILSAAVFLVSFLVYAPMYAVMAVKNASSPYYIFFLTGLAVSLLLAFIILQSVRHRATLKRLGFYNQVMEESPEADVLVTALAERASVSPGQAEKDLRWLFGKRILRDCRMDRTKEPAVLLSDVSRGMAVFAALDCPGCGSTSRIRAGRAGKCRYCGRFLTAPMKGSISKAMYSGIPGKLEALYDQWKTAGRYTEPGSFTDTARQEAVLRR